MSDPDFPPLLQALSLWWTDTDQHELPLGQWLRKCEAEGMSDHRIADLFTARTSGRYKMNRMAVRHYLLGRTYPETSHTRNVR